MKRTALATLMLILLPSVLTAGGLHNLFFLHHSTGRNLLDDSAARSLISQINAAEKNSPFELWDHDYNYIGLRDPQGNFVGSYQIPDDNTDPDGLHALWTTQNDARERILANHQVIAFKSCYPASDIASDAMLDQYKQWYLDIRDELGRHPDHVFVVMSQPPRHRLATNPDHATRARAFADWLGSAEFLAGHPNIRYFDLFDRMAAADDGSDTANMLRYEYERSHADDDSHPNTLANQTVGPEFIHFLCEAAAVATPAETMSMGEVKALFR